MIRKKPKKEAPSLPIKSEFLLYQTEDGETRIEVRLHDETVWTTQADVAELYQTTPQNNTSHLKVIYGEGELEEAVTCKEYLQVQPEGIWPLNKTRSFITIGWPRRLSRKCSLMMVN